MAMVTTGNEYDFIVIGGGTAGNAVAGRLAENPRVRVLIVEAGVPNPDQVEAITTPSKAFELRGSKHDWAYKSTMIKRDDYERIEKPNTRGKVLGGSSSANYFTWIPGSKPTFDDWEEFGGSEWTWESCVSYLRKCATYHDDEKLYPTQLSKIGSGGPIQISHADLVPEMKPFRDALTEAWLSKGEQLTDDIYEGEMRGLTFCCDTIYNGQRQGSFLYLKDKPNVTILYNVQSKELLIDPATNTCTGVRVASLSSGTEISVYASREVILSQGVFETPKLLMLSGVGPAAALSQHGIPVKVDSQHVGQHLLDHPIVPFVLQVKDGYGLDDYILRSGSSKNQLAVASYQRDKTGPISSGLLELVGFPRIDERLEKYAAYREAKAANGGLDPFGPAGQPHFELDFVGLFSTAFQWHYPVPESGNYMTVIVDLLRPLSEGQVTLNSADPYMQPNINLNFFGNDLDILAMTEGVRWTYDLLTTGAGFKDIVVAEYPWKMPLDSDEEMKRAVLDRSQTGFHPCGTARLSKSIHQGVVDPSLRVHGIKNLRIADASVIPVIPDCRIQNSVYMIGEKAADMIKASHMDLYKRRDNVSQIISRL